MLYFMNASVSKTLYIYIGIFHNVKFKCDMTAKHDGYTGVEGRGEPIYIFPVYSLYSFALK